jgi:hypothetical protein
VCSEYGSDFDTEDEQVVTGLLSELEGRQQVTEDDGSRSDMTIFLHKLPIELEQWIDGYIDLPSVLQFRLSIRTSKMSRPSHPRVTLKLSNHHILNVDFRDCFKYLSTQSCEA